MTAQSKTTIKSYFQTGDKPTQAQFVNLIDSYQDAATNLGTLSSASVTPRGLQLLASTSAQVGDVGLQVLAAATSADVINIIGAASLDSPTFMTAVNITRTDDGSSGVVQTFFHNTASPATSDVIYNASYTGKSSTGVTRTYGLIRNVIDDPTNTSEDSRWDIQTIVAGSLATRIKIGGGLVVGTPTGDDLGTGTVNATGVYDDGVLLTCYPIQMYLQGTVDLGYWDLYAGGEHKPAHSFVEKMKTTDLLDVDTYIKEWKDNQGLPAFRDMKSNKLSIGEVNQKIMETLDIFAIHIDKLNHRIKKLEANNHEQKTENSD